MRRLAPALILLVAACNSGESAKSTTSSTAVPGITTTEQVATTVSPATTITTAAITTTSPPTTTTSTPGPLEGNWAERPLITTGFGALGWWGGADWVDASEERGLPVAGGEDYQVVRLGRLAMTTAGPETIVCEPLELMGVELEEPQLLGDFPGPYGVSVSAPWTSQPHLFEEITDDGTYARFAGDLLFSRGLDVADPLTKQVFRTDLEGDGVNEVLVVAEDVPQDFLMEHGDYSIAFMRKVIEGGVQTAVLAETVAMDEEDTFDGAHSFGGGADLNGDGKMELIMNSAFFEGFDVAIWEYVNDGVGLVQVLQIGCGV